MQDIRDRLGSNKSDKGGVVKGSSPVKEPSQKSQLAKTQVESVRIEDSSGQQSSEKRDGLVGSRRLEGRYTSSLCYKCRVV
jgi:hypothetical protein